MSKSHMDARFDISIIIVNYNSSAFTRACLNSIRSSQGGLRLEVIVIDNGSFDGCGESIRSEFPEVTFIQNPVNLGFAGANNLGASLSQAAHLLFLNPDTEVRPNAIAELLHALVSKPDAGIVGGHLLNSDMSVQTTSIAAFPTISNQLLGADFFRRNLPQAKLWGMKPLFDTHSAPVEVDAISGACMLVRRDVFEQVQGFSRDYFMYGEDVDLCLKVRKAERRVYYRQQAVIVHHGGRSSGARRESNYAEVMIRESLLHFMRAHRGNGYARLFRAGTACAAVLRLLLVLVSAPVWSMSAQRRSFLRAWQKWWSICLWSIGVQGWVRTERSSPLRAADRTTAC